MNAVLKPEKKKGGPPKGFRAGQMAPEQVKELIMKRAAAKQERDSRRGAEIKGDMFITPGYAKRIAALPPLTEMEQKFVHNVAFNGMPPEAAMRAAGYSPKSIKSARTRLMANLKIQHAVSVAQEQFRIASLMTKRRVMDGFLEAIDVARVQADSLAMTSGWREIAKMCGYFEPTRHTLEVSVNGKVVIEKLQSMSDEQLLQLADGNTEALEGEFEIVSKD